MLAFESTPLPINQPESANPTADPVRNIADRIADFAAEKTESARHSLSEFSTQITEKTGEATDAASRTVGEAWDAVAQTAHSAVDRVSDLKNTATGQIDEIADGANRLSHALLESLAGAFSKNIQTWLDSHPTLDWFWHHPIAFLVLLLAIAVLSLGLLRAIAGWSEIVVIGLLKLPVKLLRGAFQLAARSSGLSRTDTSPFVSPEKRLETLVARLEAIREEEHQILREISAELKSRNNRDFSLERRLTVEDRNF